MRRGYADTRLGQIHYATAGGVAGTPLLLLPQGGRSYRMFEELAAELAASVSLIAVDYPGSGQSDPLPDGTAFADIAAAFIDLADRLGHARVSVYGLHTGNKIAAAMAAGWPERVERVILAGQSHSLVPSKAARDRTVGTTRGQLLDAPDPREAALVHWADTFSVVSGLWWREDLMRDFANPYARHLTLVRAADELLSTQSMPALYRANFAYDLEADLRRIRIATLILEIATAREDKSIGRQGPVLQAMIAGSRLATLEEPDFHGITLEHRAADLAAILRGFLSP